MRSTLAMLLLLSCLPLGAVSVDSRFAPLPALFTGDLPCADCAGIRYRLNLFADRVFFLEMRYLGRDDSLGVYDIGRWDYLSDGSVLVLQGGRDAPLHFAVVDTNMLRKLDREARPIDSSLNYSLERAPRFEMLEPALTLRGLYSYTADAGLFTECLTGRRWPVDASADNLALERAYLAVRQQPAEPLLVLIDAQIVPRPAMEGDGEVVALVPSRFHRIEPGRDCGEPFRTQSLSRPHDTSF